MANGQPVVLDRDKDGNRIWTQPVTFPGTDPAQLREAFRALNAWARELHEWQDNVRAFCLILQTRYGITPEDVQSVAALFKDKTKDHSPKAAREVLKKGSAAARIFVGAVDVVGHPPDNPFLEPITPDP